jgi:uroporphyrin-III C-methyltransferase/precorrin-2 dehydrogenase/sirohydrochlorin ferrochelatase
MNMGFVSLVGAGPGDPDLLTRKAVRALRAADLVLYDALVDRTVMRIAPRAHWFYVGKRAHRPSVRQETINALMIRAARRGKCVVRLKCGDPFVLGRGGEEALALAAAGIRFEVVPGVTTAIAAPALANIPVTHRGLASGFVLVSGHDEAAYGPVLGSIAPGSATVVVLMGLRARVDIANLLMGRGWNAATPAAVLFAASTTRQETWIGTLGALASASVPSAADRPGTIVVGDVVSVGAQLAGMTAEVQDEASIKRA